MLLAEIKYKLVKENVENLFSQKIKMFKQMFPGAKGKKLYVAACGISIDSEPLMTQITGLHG